MSHAIIRTSPKGQTFIGRCHKCGAENLGMADALRDCPADSLINDTQALIDIIGEEQGGAPK